MRRRDFITLLGGASAWPLAARAQQPAKLPTIGFLGAATPSAWSSWTAAFVQRLRELGWIEGRTIAIEYRWAEGHPERIAEIATEFVRSRSMSSSRREPRQSSQQCRRHRSFRSSSGRRATRSAPVWSRVWRDQAAMSPACPISRPILPGKRLELLREVLPGLRRFAIMANVGNPIGVLEMDDVQAAARTLGIEVAPLEIRRAEDIAPAFEALKAQADALYVVGDALIAANRTRIITLSLSARLPTIFNARDYVQAGGLMSYGAKLPGSVPARRRVGRQDSARDEARRYSGRAADQIRARHQSHDRQGARLDDPRIVPAARRRGDRMRRRDFITLLGGAAAAWPLAARAAAEGADNRRSGG